MDAQTLRWALVGIGLVIIVVIVAVSGRSENRKAKKIKRKASVPGEPRETAGVVEEVDEVGEAGDFVVQEDLELIRELGDMIAADRGGEKTGAVAERPEPEPAAPRSAGQAALEARPEERPEERPEKRPEERPAAARPDEVITIYLETKGRQKIHGHAILDAAVKTGLVFGKMHLFHRVPDGGNISLFSLANGLKPGFFDPAEWSVLETPMLTLFFSLPSPYSGLDAFDTMLATARRLADLLDLNILDHRQMPLNRERIGEIRDRLRKYDRQQEAGEH